LALARYRIFLLSPANAAGVRAQRLMHESAMFDLAVRLRCQSVPIGELFSFMSGLYFRGKLAYAEAFAAPPPGVSGTYVITAAGGLLIPQTPLTLESLRQLAAVPIDAADARYRMPLERDAQALHGIALGGCEIVLLGSIAEAKYIQPLVAIFGDRLVFPAEFVGRGDMSRGGLMLRCAQAGTELEYIPAQSATRRGARPPKLPQLRKRGD